MTDFEQRRTRLLEILLNCQNNYPAAHALRQLMSYGRSSGAPETLGVRVGCSIALAEGDPNKISYQPDPERDRRVMLSVGKFFSKMRRDGYVTDVAATVADCERLATDWHVLVAPKYDDRYYFTRVKGEDIFDAYTNGPDSCMQGADRRQLEMYLINPDKVELLLIHDKQYENEEYDEDDEMCEYYGRALLWHTDEGGMVMDRVYPSDRGLHARAARAYAAEQGWDYLTEDGVGRPFTTGNCYTVTLKAPEHSQPYMDSFRYIEVPSKFPAYYWTISNYHHDHTWYNIPAGEERPWERWFYCQITNTRTPGCEVVLHPYYGEVSIAGMAQLHAHGVDVDGVYYTRGDVVADRHGRDIPRHRGVELPDGSYAHIDDCVTTWQGAYVLRDTALRVNQGQFETEWVLPDDAHVDGDEVWVRHDWELTRGHTLPRFRTTTEALEWLAAQGEGLHLYNRYNGEWVARTTTEMAHHFREGVRDARYKWSWAGDTPVLVVSVSSVRDYENYQISTTSGVAHWQANREFRTQPWLNPVFRAVNSLGIREALGVEVQNKLEEAAKEVASKVVTITARGWLDPTTPRMLEISEEMQNMLSEVFTSARRRG